MQSLLRHLEQEVDRSGLLVAVWVAGAAFQCWMAFQRAHAVLLHYVGHWGFGNQVP